MRFPRVALALAVRPLAACTASAFQTADGPEPSIAQSELWRVATASGALEQGPRRSFSGRFEVTGADLRIDDIAAATTTCRKIADQSFEHRLFQIFRSVYRFDRNASRTLRFHASNGCTVTPMTTGRRTDRLIRSYWYVHEPIDGNGSNVTPISRRLRHNKLCAISYHKKRQRCNAHNTRFSRPFFLINTY